MVHNSSRTMERLERWIIIGDGLSYSIIVVPDTDPLEVQEVLGICHCQNAVITMFDALAGDFLGMAYCSANRATLEFVRYGRRKEDINFYVY